MGFDNGWVDDVVWIDGFLDVMYVYLVVFDGDFGNGCGFGIEGFGYGYIVCMVCVVGGGERIVFLFIGEIYGCFE